MDPAMTIFREAAGSSLFEGPTLVSVSPPLSYSSSLAPLCIAMPLSFPLFTSPFSMSGGTATLSSTTVKALVRRMRKSPRTCYLLGFIRVLLDGRCTLPEGSLSSSRDLVTLPSTDMTFYATNSRYSKGIRGIHKIRARFRFIGD